MAEAATLRAPRATLQDSGRTASLKKTGTSPISQSRRGAAAIHFSMLVVLVMVTFSRAGVSTRSAKPVLSCDDDAMAERVEDARRVRDDSLCNAAVRC